MTIDIEQLIFITPDAEHPGAWLRPLGLDEFKADEAAPLNFRKELIYAGELTLQDHNGKRFSRRIERAMLEHWAKTDNALIANGNEVPLPVGHTKDPAAKKGTIIKLAVEKNSRGGDALFAYGRFNDAEAAKAYGKAQVSIWVDPKHVDGAGNEYVSPIRHVALTDYPIIPKLDKFEAMPAIAASLLSPPVTPKESDMNIRELAKKVGVKLTDEEKDEAISEKLAAHVEGMSTRLSEFEKAKAKADKETAKETEPPKKIAAGLLGILRDNRELKLAGLVKDCKITPAVKDELAKQFCSDDALSLALADDGSTKADGFDTVLSALTKNEAVISMKEKTGAQTLGELSLADESLKKSGDESPLVKNAEARAKAATSK
jgi:hypothetical protein